MKLELEFHDLKIYIRFLTCYKHIKTALGIDNLSHDVWFNSVGLIVFRGQQFRVQTLLLSVRDKAVGEPNWSDLSSIH